MIGLLILALTFLFSAIILLRIYSRRQLKHLAQKPDIRKQKNRFRKTRSVLIWNISICISLLTVFSGFEWKTYGPNDPLDFNDESDRIFEEYTVPPITEIDAPPKPKKVKKIEVPGPEIREIESEIEESTEPIHEPVPTKPGVIIEDPPEEEIEVPFVLVPEVQPEPAGGIQSWVKFLSRNIRYPREAKRRGVEGKVFVEFIIGADGKIRDCKIIKGIGSGCDEEAIRVLKKAPKWNPGLQRGRPVPVKVIMPINFKLG